MTPFQVVELIGKPDRINPATTAAGRNEQWVYSEDTLVGNIRGPGAAIGNAFRMGLTDRRPEQICLYFENGSLTSTQGF